MSVLARACRQVCPAFFKEKLNEQPALGIEVPWGGSKERRIESKYENCSRSVPCQKGAQTPSPELRARLQNWGRTGALFQIAQRWRNWKPTSVLNWKPTSVVGGERRSFKAATLAEFPLCQPKGRESEGSTRTSRPARSRTSLSSHVPTAGGKLFNADGPQ